MTASGEIAIRLRGLVKNYGRRRALAGIDLELVGPQVVGVIGPDGAGKTTLLRALVGLLDVEAETASVLGFDLTAPDLLALKQRVGYVPQSFSLHRDLSVLENLRFTARLHRLSEEERARRAGPLLEQIGLAPFQDRPAGALSGGMKQKLAIVNALLSQPDLLVLDEPTAGVDVVARGEILQILQERRRAMLVVVSTSYLDEMTACDRLVYLDEGKVIATGTPSELQAHADVDLYRAWGRDAFAIAAAARALPWVAEAHASGEFARIEVPGTRLGPADVRRALGAVDVRRPLGAVNVRRALGALAGVDLVERIAVDMEATLLALARPASAS